MKSCSSSTLEAIQKILKEEEYHGTIILNRFRYITCVVWSALVFLAAGDGGKEAVLTNFSFLGCFFGVTILRSIFIKKGIRSFRIINYCTILVDFCILITMPIYYWISYNPGNYNFVLKNPLLWLLLIPIATTAIQFRIEYIVFSISIFLISVFGLYFGAFYYFSELTNSWNEFVLGDKLFLGASAGIYASTVLLVAGITIYTVIRATGMLKRIGQTEAEKLSFARYFSPNVVEEITKNPETIEAGKKQKVTILLLDIRNFTRMSETMDANEIAHILTELRRIWLDSIFQWNGTLDKFMGDAVMATFGTPKPGEKDARNAIQCALEILKKMRYFNEERKRNQEPPIEIGIGIHTGEVFAGNIGDEFHLEYSVIGDAVNTASRIESLCKEFGVQLLVSEETLQESRIPAENAKKMPLIEVKGKSKPVQVYALSTLLEADLQQASDLESSRAL